MSRLTPAQLQLEARVKCRLAPELHLVVLRVTSALQWEAATSALTAVQTPKFNLASFGYYPTTTLPALSLNIHPSRSKSHSVSDVPFECVYWWVTAKYQLWMLFTIMHRLVSATSAQVRCFWEHSDSEIDRQTDQFIPYRR